MAAGPPRPALSLPLLFSAGGGGGAGREEKRFLSPACHAVPPVDDDGPPTLEKVEQLAQSNIPVQRVLSVSLLVEFLSDSLVAATVPTRALVGTLYRIARCPVPPSPRTSRPSASASPRPSSPLLSSQPLSSPREAVAARHVLSSDGKAVVSPPLSHASPSSDGPGQHRKADTLFEGGSLSEHGAGSQQRDTTSSALSSSTFKNSTGHSDATVSASGDPSASLSALGASPSLPDGTKEGDGNGVSRSGSFPGLSVPGRLFSSLLSGGGLGLSLRFGSGDMGKNGGKGKGRDEDSAMFSGETQADAAVRKALCARSGDIAACLIQADPENGYRRVYEDLLPLFELLVQSAEDVPTKKAAADAILLLATHLRAKERLEQVLPIALRLSNALEAPNLRLIAVSFLHFLFDISSPVVSMHFVLPQLLFLADEDLDPAVRCCALRHVAALSASLDALLFSSRVFPTFERLFRGQITAQKDGDLSIRIAAVASLYDIAKASSLSVRLRVLLPALEDLLEDPSPMVRLAARQQLGRFLSSVAGCLDPQFTERALRYEAKHRRFRTRHHGSEVLSTSRDDRVVALASPPFSLFSVPGRCSPVVAGLPSSRPPPPSPLSSSLDVPALAIPPLHPSSSSPPASTGGLGKHLGVSENHLPRLGFKSAANSVQQVLGLETGTGTKQREGEFEEGDEEEEDGGQQAKELSVDVEAIATAVAGLMRQFAQLALGEPVVGGGDEVSEGDTRQRSTLSLLFGSSGSSTQGDTASPSPFLSQAALASGGTSVTSSSPSACSCRTCRRTNFECLQTSGLGFLASSAVYPSFASSSSPCAPQSGVPSLISPACPLAPSSSPAFAGAPSVSPSVSIPGAFSSTTSTSGSSYIGGGAAVFGGGLPFQLSGGNCCFTSGGEAVPHAAACCAFSFAAVATAAGGLRGWPFLHDAFGLLVHHHCAHVRKSMAASFHLIAAAALGPSSCSTAQASSTLSLPSSAERPVTSPSTTVSGGVPGCQTHARINGACLTTNGAVSPRPCEAMDGTPDTPEEEKDSRETTTQKREEEEEGRRRSEAMDDLDNRERHFLAALESLLLDSDPDIQLAVLVNVAQTTSFFSTPRRLALVGTLQTVVYTSEWFWNSRLVLAQQLEPLFLLKDKQLRKGLLSLAFTLLQDSVAIVRKAACRCLPALLSSCCQDLLKAVPARPLPRFVHDLCCDFRRTRSLGKQKDACSSSISAPESASSEPRRSQVTCITTEPREETEAGSAAPSGGVESADQERPDEDDERPDVVASQAEARTTSEGVVSEHFESVRGLSRTPPGKKTNSPGQGNKGVVPGAEGRSGELGTEKFVDGEEEKPEARESAQQRRTTDVASGREDAFRLEGKKGGMGHEETEECMKQKETADGRHTVVEEERKRTRRLLTTGEEVAVICDILEVFAGSPRFAIRQLYIHMCDQIIRHCPRSLFELYFMRALAYLSSDRVANVRLTWVKLLLPHLRKPNGKLKDNCLLVCAAKSLRKTEEDRETRLLLENCVLAEDENLQVIDGLELGDFQWHQSGGKQHGDEREDVAVCQEGEVPEPGGSPRRDPGSSVGRAGALKVEEHQGRGVFRDIDGAPRPTADQHGQQDDSGAEDSGTSTRRKLELGSAEADEKQDDKSGRRKARDLESVHTAGPQAPDLVSYMYTDRATAEAEQMAQKVQNADQKQTPDQKKDLFCPSHQFQNAGWSGKRQAPSPETADASLPPGSVVCRSNEAATDAASLLELGGQDATSFREDRTMVSVQASAPQQKTIVALVEEERREAAACEWFAAVLQAEAVSQESNGEHQVSGSLSWGKSPQDSLGKSQEWGRGGEGEEPGPLPPCKGPAGVWQRDVQRSCAFVIEEGAFRDKTEDALDAIYGMSRSARVGPAEVMGAVEGASQRGTYWGVEPQEEARSAASADVRTIEEAEAFWGQPSDEESDETEEHGAESKPTLACTRGEPA